jgi:cysteine-rich repeat protein
MGVRALFRSLRALTTRRRILAAAVTLLLSGCGDRPEVHLREATDEAIVLQPPLATFAVFATRSVRLRDRVQVIGGNVGSQRAVTGALLFPGFEVAFDLDTRADVLFGVYGDSVRLDSRAQIGDLFVNQLVQNPGATFVSQNPFLQQTALPPNPAILPGTQNISVAPRAVMTLAPGRYNNVSTSGTLRLSGGTYQFRSLTIDNDSRVEAQTAVDIRVLERVLLRDRAFVGPRVGTTIRARDVRLTALGANGGTGPLTTPLAIGVGSDSSFRALILAPNGTFTSGQRGRVTGSVVARDVLLDLDARVTLEDGIQFCDPAACNDTNPCTVSRCENNACVHVPVAAGTTCDDTTVCNGRETCNATGTCVPGAPPIVNDDNLCTTDSCDPMGGVMHVPTAPGTPCPSNGDVCDGPEACDGAGVCRSGMPIDTDDGNPCTTDSCNPMTGPVHTPVTIGTSCEDDDVCDGEEVCLAGGVCQGVPPDPLPDECTTTPPDSEFCGDGIRDPVTEECDDGPGMEEDSCTPDCRVHNIFVRPVTSPGGLRLRSRSLGFAPHPAAATSTATLVAFSESEASNFSFKGALFDHQGRRTALVELGVDAVPSEFADGVVAALPGGAFATAWSELGNGSLDVGLRLVSPVSTPVVGDLHYANVTFPGPQQDPDLVWTGSELVVAWTDVSSIKARRFSSDLTPLTTDEQPLSPANEVSGAVSLVRFGSDWAAAWRALDASGDELIRVRTGSVSWTVGPFVPGETLERPTLVDLDATHLLLVFTEGTDPLDTGTPSVTRLRAAILDTAAPGNTTFVELEPMLEPYASDPAITLRRPTLARVSTRLFLGWESEGLLGDPLGSEIWVQRLRWSGALVGLQRDAEEPIQADAPRPGNQFAPSFASSPLIPQGALVTVWEEHSPESRHETTPDVFFGLRPVPFVRLPAFGGE